MAISQKFVRHDDGRNGVIIEGSDQTNYRVVVCDTGEEESWNYLFLTWLHLVPDQISAPSR